MSAYRCVKCTLGVVMEKLPPPREKCDHCDQYTDKTFGVQIIFECNECKEIYEAHSPMFSSADPCPIFELERI